MPRGVYNRNKVTGKLARRKRATNPMKSLKSMSDVFSYHKGWLDGFEAAGRIWRGTFKQ